MSEYRYLYCGRVISPRAEFQNVLIEVRDGRIAGVVPDARIPDAHDCLDLSDFLVVPGFIDVHVHGGSGHDAADGDLETICHISTHLAGHGVTSFLPTIVTSPWEQVLRAMEAVKLAMDKGTPGARVLGAHLEGPFLNLEHKGAQPEEHIRVPDVAEFEAYLRDFLAYIRVVTLAPEAQGAEDLIEYLVQQGIVVSAGHTSASHDQMIKAIGMGLRSATHIYNAMSAFHHREPGIVGAVLTDDRVFAELVWDNLHVHPDAASLVVRAKGAGRVMLVSDAIRAAGLPDGAYDLGGQAVYVREGVARLSDGTIAGSTIALDRAVRNASVHVGLRSAVEMATLTPATAIGVANTRGAVEVGLAADFAVLDRDLNVHQAIISGQSV